MAPYEPGKNVLLYEENNYRVTGNIVCLVIDENGLRQATAGHKIEKNPPGCDPIEFIYVPYVLIRAAAKESIEEFSNSLETYITEAYVRSHK